MQRSAQFVMFAAVLAMAVTPFSGCIQEGPVARPATDTAPATEPAPEASQLLSSTRWFEPLENGDFRIVRAGDDGLVTRSGFGVGPFGIAFDHPALALVGGSTLPSVTNYLVGPESDWRTNVAHHDEVRMLGLAPGLDARVYLAESGELEWDFLAAPGADLSKATFQLVGAEAATLMPDGTLQALVEGETVTLQAPVAYQPTPNGLVAVDSAFRLDGVAVSFTIGSRDVALPIVIDPIITWGSYLGGSGNDRVEAVAMSPLAGERAIMYVTGFTNDPGSADPTDIPFPTRELASPRPYAPFPYETGSEGFVAKIDTSKSGAASLVWVTFLGGDGKDTLYDVAATTAGVGVVGTTVAGASGGQWPLTGSAFATSFAGKQDAVFTMLSHGGDRLLYSTLFGGNDKDVAYAVAFDSTGKALVAGQTGYNATGSMPTASAFQGTHADTTTGAWDAFAAKFDPSRSGTASLVYATYVGSTGPDVAYDLAAGPGDMAWLTGATSPSTAVGATPFPTRSDSYQPGRDGTYDNAFVVAVPPDGGAGLAELPFATLIGSASTYDIWGKGSPGTQGLAIAVNANGVYAGGHTSYYSYDMLPYFYGVFHPYYNYYSDGWIAKFNPALTGASQLTSATFMGGYYARSVQGLALDPAGNVVVTGTNSFSSIGRTYCNTFHDAYGYSVGYVLRLDANLGPSDTSCPGSGSSFFFKQQLGNNNAVCTDYSDVGIGTSSGGSYPGYYTYTVGDGTRHPVAVNSLGEIAIATFGGASCWYSPRGFQTSPPAGGKKEDGLLAFIQKAPPRVQYCYLPSWVYRGDAWSYTMVGSQGDAAVDMARGATWTMDVDAGLFTSTKPLYGSSSSFSSVNPSFVYPLNVGAAKYAPGPKTVRMSASDVTSIEPIAGFLDCVVDVRNRLPLAVMMASATTQNVGQAFTFDAAPNTPTGTRDLDGTVVKTQWILDRTDGATCTDPATGTATFTGAKLVCTFSTPGVRNLSLLATDDEGGRCANAFTDCGLGGTCFTGSAACPAVLSITVVQPGATLFPGFTWSMKDPVGTGTLGPAQLYTCEGPVLIDFRNTSTGGSHDYKWDFDGDGKADRSTTSVIDPASWTFPGAGSYPVTLSASNAAGTVKVGGTVNIERSASPHVILQETSGTTSPYLDGTTLRFVDDSTQGQAALAGRTWTLNDGTEIDGALSNFEHTFAAGTNHVTLVRTDARGCTSSASLEFQMLAPRVPPVPEQAFDLKRPPTAAFLATPAPVAVGQVVNVLDLSVAGTQPIATYAWDFGDGDVVFDNHEPQHRYDTLGTYTMRLTVVDTAGMTGSTERAIQVVSPEVLAAAKRGQPQANAGADRDADVGQVVRLEAIATGIPDGTPALYQWTQLSGPAVALSAATNRSAAFMVPPLPPGAQDATAVFRLVVSDGATASRPDNVAIHMLPGAVPGFSSLVTGPTLRVEANNLGAGKVATWDFGDGTTGSGEVQEHLYAKPGTYTVTMHADGPSDVSHTVEVGAGSTLGGARGATSEKDPAPKILGMSVTMAVLVFVGAAIAMAGVLWASMRKA